MPMEKERHEALLTELLGGEIEHSRKTEILQELRVDYGTVHSDFGALTSERDKLKGNNDDLIVSNSQLFRQLGYLGTDPKQKEKEEEKSFSETITLSALENK